MDTPRNTDRFLDRIILLFLFALSMIFGESKPEEETRLAEAQHETAIFPLAVPSIAGPETHSLWWARIGQ